MPTLYRIKAWGDTFESRLDAKRPKRRMPWFSYPNDSGSTGLAMLLGGWSQNGRTGLALWPLLLSIVADLPAEQRDGSLIRADGTPHTRETIAARCRIPSEDVAAGIEALLGSGWLVEETGAVTTRSENPRKFPEVSALVRAGERDLTGRDVTRLDETEKREHAPDGAPVPAGTIANDTAPPKPKRAPRTKLPETPWPEGWTFGDAEWETAERAGCPSRQSAALAFDGLRAWAEQKQVLSLKWSLRWATWCAGCRDRYGWPKPASGGSSGGRAASFEDVDYSRR